MEYVAFNAERWSEPVWWAVLAVILAAVLDGHLRLFASAPPKRVAFGATAASLAIVGLSLVISVGTRWQQERWSSNLPFSGYLKPPSARVVRSHSLDEFFVVADRLRSEVDRLATEKR